MKLRMLFFLPIAVAVFMFSTTVWAAPFPSKTDEVVQDEEGYLDEKQKESFIEFVEQYTDTYKVVVVESVLPEAADVDEYAQKLYDNYNLAENAMMIVLDINTQELGVYPGPALQEKGAKMEMLHEKIVTYYKPFSTEKKYMLGIQTFVAEMNNELKRIAAKADAAAGEEQPASEPTAEQQETDSLWSFLPWWVYVLAALFLLSLIALLYAFVRRNSILSELDRVEDWKDDLVEKIQMIDVDKPLRRATGATEEWYAQLANRKENLLRMRIPDVEMIILEAEEACDRLRFRVALDLIAEGEEVLTALEGELAELKSDSTKVVEKKKENTTHLPEIGKLAEQCERKLTNARLEYGLTFHELKGKLDEAERMHRTVKELLAGGDTMKAHEVTEEAQTILQGVLQSLERLPQLINRVQKEMVAELKQLEDDIAIVEGDGYDLSQTQLDASLLQIKQLLISAETSLEEGNLEHVEMHIKAFAIKLDATYQSMEEAVLSQRQAAAAAVLVEERTPQEKPSLGGIAEAVVASSALRESLIDLSAKEEAQAVASAAEQVGLNLAASRQEAEQAAEHEQLPADPLPTNEVELTEYDPLPSETRITIEADDKDETAGQGSVSGSDFSTSDEERSLLLARNERLSEERLVLEADDEAEEPQPAASAEVAYDDHDEDEQDTEYELVMPKPLGVQAATEKAVEVETGTEAETFLIETEDDALDMMEYIANSLIRIRQQLKRSYLPGIPDDVTFRFDQVVQSLGRIKMLMERYEYELQEVTEMLQEAREELQITQKMADDVISYCQKAEGAIQYTNRYRRQNRQVHEMLTKAEQAFRQLRFAEAFSFAEEARLLVEQETEEAAGSNWLLRRKKKGAGE
ncbi:TPM domain-containing protein [Brevibacillus humidisoli]|uniref:septation ring formation regulator EzrA n=1 Tax=Brevibacillus humidisoli TaxID=2895522 RepID=UPI001E2980C5|nr:septation ring formation regulator EzrA [Brevibacillus humidisoli]UFJ41570.1 TPM domain-containing protein [Brevibacillus humidisoli]